MPIEITLHRHLGEAYDESDIEAAVQQVEERYLPHSAGKYLYKLLLQRSVEDKFCADSLELLYATLGAWGMNSRAAQLEDFDTFCRTVQGQKNNILALEAYDITQFAACKDALRAVFMGMNLSKSKSKLVTNSKALHFLLPNLVAPIDRRYTLTFYQRPNIPEKIERQFALFAAIHEDFSDFSRRTDLSRFLSTETWNQTVPKLIDTLVIAQNLA